jgi:hypothetical protein
LARGERNTYWALAIFLAAFLASYPSPISNAYLATLSSEWAAIIRVDIWAFAVLTALPVFTFTGQLTPLPRDKTPITLITLRSFVLEWAFFALILWWLYVIYSGLREIS